MLVAEMAGGLLAGLLVGLAFGLIRPLIGVIVVVAAIAVVATLILTGVSGLLNVFGRIAADIGHHAPFFASLAVGNFVSGALVLR